jgi:hypothetical protein
MLFLFLQFIAAVTEFVKNELGQQFIESPAADLAEVYKDLNNTTPLIFVLSQGSGMDCQQCCIFKWLYVGRRVFDANFRFLQIQWLDFIDLQPKWNISKGRLPYLLVRDKAPSQSQ